MSGAFCCSRGGMYAVQPIVVPGRFNGPATSGNGGWVSGRLAALLEPAPDEAVRVVLRSPPPLDVPLQVQIVADGGRSVWSGDSAVAAVNRVPSPFDAAAPGPVPWSVAQASASAYGGAVNHPFPTCFGCGPLREPVRSTRPSAGRRWTAPAAGPWTWWGVPRHRSMASRRPGRRPSRLRRTRHAGPGHGNE